MSVLKSQRPLPLVLSFVLLLMLAVPSGFGSAYPSHPPQSAARGKILSIAAGSDHSLALKADGTVVVWGRNNHGQLNMPSGLGGVKSIAAGTFHSLALKSDGTVVAWGNNTYGQSNVPADLEEVVAISAGIDHSMALKVDGTVVGWGSSASHQAEVPAELAVPGAATAIAAGYLSSLALKSDGTVVAWGDNTYDQSNVPAGLEGVVAIAAGGYHSMALKSDGTVVAWGKNMYHESEVPLGLDGVVAISAGLDHSLALKADGTVVAWGQLTGVQFEAPGDDHLSGLTVQEGDLDPAFSAGVTDYSTYVAASVNSVHVTATLADADSAELYVDGKPHASGTVAEVSTPGASTEIRIRVEPYLKPGRTYKITVQKDDAPPNVLFDPNGQAAPAQTAESTVTVTDAESGVDAASLWYAWTQSTAVPASGWTSCANGATLKQTSGDGNWYLHIRAQDQVGNVTDAVSNAFVLDNTAPVLALNGGNPIHIPQGGTYTEPGATVTDALDGVIPPSNIAISGALTRAALAITRSNIRSRTARGIPPR